MKIITLHFSLSIILLFTSFASAQNCAPSKDLPNFGCINANFYRGAQPTEEGIKELARRGIKTIINLRGADKKAQIEENQARNAGIKFINIPLNNWSGPKDADIKQIIALIDSPENQPVFVHCKRGADRTGTVIAVYRITRDSWTAKQAKTEAKTFRFGWWQFRMKDYIEDYYEDLKKLKSKN
jgi:protein tyrosine/serine phosphatase